MMLSYRLAGHRIRIRNQTMFDKIDLQRIAVSSIGALILSTASIVAVAGPAKAAPFAPIAVTQIASSTN
jgi:hypothetical protein